MNEQELNELESLHKQSEAEQERIKNLQDDLIRMAKSLAIKHCPEITHLEAEGYRQLENRIVRHCVNLACEISNINYKHDSERD